MMKLATIIWTVVLLPGTAMAAVEGTAISAEHEPVVAVTQGAGEIRPSSTETLHGVVDSVDQRSGAIKIRLSSGATERFKVQDGLIFDAVRFGDPVEVLVQSIDGVRTIVGLWENNGGEDRSGSP